MEQLTVIEDDGTLNHHALHFEVIVPERSYVRIHGFICKHCMERRFEFVLKTGVRTFDTSIDTQGMDRYEARERIVQELTDLVRKCVM